MTRASCVLFWFSMTLVVSLGLYHTSYRVDRLTHDLHALNSKIKMEQRNIHVLKAEWVYLSNPTRIEKAARKHLDLAPTKIEQIASLKKLTDLLSSTLDFETHQEKKQRSLASFRPRPAASTPKAIAEEKGRINRRLVIGSRATRNLPQKTGYHLAGDNSYGIGSYGGAP